MRTKIAITFAACVVAASIAAVARTQQDRAGAGKLTQVVVRVHRSPTGLQYEMRSYDGLKKAVANYWLAEIKLRECADCQVIPIIDDNVEVGAITEMSEMAINAGFKDIRPFVYWRKTGQMAQIQFGPPIKYTTDAKKIERRVERD